MKTSTKILLISTFLSFVAMILFFPIVYSRSVGIIAGVAVDYDAVFIAGIISSILFSILSNILFIKIINNLKLSQKLFVISVPLSFMFGGLVFSLININTPTFDNLTLVKQTLNINATNSNNIIWAVILSLIYVLIMFLIFWLVCRPVNKVSKAVERLGDGKVRNVITIGGGKQFKEIEYSLNKINNNYKANENLIKQTNLEYEKYIPKQFLKYLGKSSVLELELGNQVKKEATTMFCDIRNSTSMSTTLSLEDNFNYINSYLKTVAPIVRKFGGFIDKYLGDGVLAVFPNASNALECSTAIIKAINAKNLQRKKAPSLEVGISLHTGEVVFGIVGEEVRKSPTIISDAVNFAGKMEEINKKFGSNVIFSKNTLNALPSNYPIAYRYIGSLQVDDKGDLISIFESLDNYGKALREKYIKNRQEFEQAVRYFYMGKYEVAKDLFQKIYKSEKEDKVCYLYFNKCEEMIAGGKAPLRI